MSRPGPDDRWRGHHRGPRHGWRDSGASDRADRPDRSPEDPARAGWYGPRGPWGGPGGPPWAAWRGFGCLFGILFLIVALSLITVVGTLLSSLGPVPGIIVALLVLALLIRTGRTLAVTARTLDRLVAATRQVEAGDYSVRVGTRRASGGGLRAVRLLTRGFDTMAARLETDERQRRTLIADISHELRTPLTVVQGNLEAILDGVYPADAAHLGIIVEETRVLGRLIDDLRTLALSEAGTLALHVEPTDLELLIGDVVRSFEPAAAAAAVDLATAVDGDLPIIDVDPVRIREVLANLVANALRHTPGGGRVTVAGAVEADARWLRLEVRDTGSGIDPALLPHVFDRFAKGDASAGSGLGLAIARQLVEAHGGEIRADSTPGAGTTMRVRLPLTGA